MDRTPHPPAGVGALKELLATGGENAPSANHETAESVAVLSSLILINAVEAIGCMAARNGMSWNESYALAAKAMDATARALLESGMHPAQLKDMLCEPGSAAIRGLNALEHERLRALLIQACYQAHDLIHGIEDAE